MFEFVCDTKLQSYRAAVTSLGNVKHIASGGDADVYAAPDSDIVYKVGHISFNEGYLNYLSVLSKQKKHNPFTPKVYSVTLGANVFIVALERLNVRKDGDSFILLLQSALHGDGQPQHILDPNLAKALDILRKAHKLCKEADWDLHRQNVMLRGYQPVIIDPLR